MRCPHPKLVSPDKVKKAIKHYFSVELIEVLCVDAKKEAKAKVKKETKAKARLQQPDMFVSPLCDLFVALISVLQYDESKYTKRAMLSLKAQTDIIDFCWNRRGS